MKTPTRRGILAAVTATAASAALTPAAAARPVVTPYARLRARLGRITYRLRLRRAGRQDSEVAELRRAVVSLVGVVEDLVDLLDETAREPR